MREIDNICTHENLAPITYLVLDSVGEFRLMSSRRLLEVIASIGQVRCLYDVVIIVITLDCPVVDDGQQLLLVPKQQDGWQTDLPTALLNSADQNALKNILFRCREYL